MTKKHIFISSVQSEFAEERKRLAEYIRQDALFRVTSSRSFSRNCQHRICLHKVHTSNRQPM